jgi:hypothetical protein
MISDNNIKNYNNTQTRTLSSLDDSYLHIRSSPFAVSVKTPLSPLHAHSLSRSSSFLYAAG